MDRSVLHVAQPTIDGVAVCVERLVIAQRDLGWDASVACPDDGPLPDLLEAAGVPMHPWDAGRQPGRDVVHEVRSLSAVVRRVDPDVVHLHSSKAGLVGRLAVRGSRPTLFHPHAWSFAAVDGPMARAALGWERFASRWTTRILCCSDDERDAGLRARISAPMEVVGNGVDLDAFAYTDAAGRAAARARLELAEYPLVVCVGRLSHQKGQDLLLRAWPEVRRGIDGAALVLVGEGPDEEALRAQAHGLDGVSFAGRREDVREWLAAADVVVFPSRYEGLSLTLLEAMATGRSIVAHAVEGMKGMIPAAALVAVGDTTALASALVTRLGDGALAENEGRAARARADADLGIDAWTRRVVAATEAVLSSS